MQSPLARPGIALALALALACGDDGGSTTAGSTSAGSTSAGSTSAGTDASASEGSTTRGGATSAGTTGTTAGTSSTAGESETGATSDGSTSDDSTSDGSTSAGTTTGGGAETPCVDDKDCVINNDCCECDAQHVDEPVANCPMECLISSCESQGLPAAQAVCRWGVCTFAKVPCNPLGVTCKALPPECGPGSAPGVQEDGDGKCWTGWCVPLEACDWAPECAACDAVPGLTCVAKLQKGAYVLCEPTPPGCGEGPVECGCAGVICEMSPPHTVCLDTAEGVACECPFC